MQLKNKKLRKKFEPLKQKGRSLFFGNKSNKINSNTKNKLLRRKGWLPRDK